MLSAALQTAINRAFDWANERDQAYVTLEHLALSLMGDSKVSEIMSACAVNISLLVAELEAYLQREIETLPEIKAHPTLNFQRVIERAIYHVQSQGEETVNATHVLAALLQENDSHFVYFLEKQQIRSVDILTYIAHGITPTEEVDWSNPEAFDGEEDGESGMDRILVSLNDLAEEGRLDPVIGRSQELHRMMEVLVRRRKNNPILVGDPGVGKTALAEALAQVIVSGDAPTALQEAEVFTLDIASLLAGTRYRGDFEQRMKQVLSQVEQRPHAVVFIDEIHTIVGAGATQGGAMDLANMLKPALALGKFRCIGATTFEEYRQIFEKDKPLARRFQKIDILEPSLADTLKILEGLKAKLEEHHGVKYQPQALKAAVDLSARYIQDRHLPDKAIDVLDEAGAKAKLSSKPRKSISEKDIRQVVSMMAKVPLEALNEKEQYRLKNLAEHLKNVVFGQDQAVDTLARLVIRAKAGLTNDTQPLGSFLLMGPTGVGKTELAKQLALHLNIPLVRFDMSEYMERHAVSRLIGAPPGYVGYDQGGLLTEAIHKQTHAVLLLDEMEKAHPDIFNILLQVMDSGKLTDNNGRVTDFSHVILLMTSNVGAEAYDRQSMGFIEQHHHHDLDNAIKQAFSPEFRNRLNGVLKFNPLASSQMRRVVDKFLFALESQIATKGYQLHISEKVRDYLAAKGYDPKMGARPLKRLVEEKLHQPLAEILLFNEPAKNARFVVELTQDDSVEILVHD